MFLMLIMMLIKEKINLPMRFRISLASFEKHNDFE